MSHAVRGVPLALKMKSFDAKIRGNQELMAWPQTQDGRVVADAFITLALWQLAAISRMPWISFRSGLGID